MKRPNGKPAKIAPVKQPATSQAAETVELIARAKYIGGKWRRVALDGSAMPVLH